MGNRYEHTGSSRCVTSLGRRNSHTARKAARTRGLPGRNARHEFWNVGTSGESGSTPWSRRYDIIRFLRSAVSYIIESQGSDLRGWTIRSHAGPSSRATTDAQSDGLGSGALHTSM